MNLANGTIISVKTGTGFSSSTQYWLATDKGFRRIVMTTHNRGIAQFAPTDDYRAAFDNEFSDANSVYDAPKNGQSLFTPIQITALKDGTRLRLPNGRTAVKKGDGYEIDGSFETFDALRQPERTKIIDEDAMLSPSPDNDLGKKVDYEQGVKPKARFTGDNALVAKDQTARKAGNVLTEESSLTDALHHMLNNIDLSDDDIRSGVRLSKNGFAKVGRKLGVTPEQAEKLYDGLQASLRQISESVKGRYSYEKDFLGNITLHDAEANKSVFLRGDDASDLLNTVNAGGDEQAILAQFASKLISESWEDEASHQDALDKTGFWGKQAAGCLILAKDTRRLLIAHRSRNVEQPLTWGTWGGAIDSGEDPVEAVRREVVEEAGYDGEISGVKPLFVFKSGTFRYYNFLVVVENEFKPRLNWESCGYEWCSYGDWPSPLHFGLTGLLKDPASSKTLKAMCAAQNIHEAADMENEPVAFGAGSYNFPWKIGTQHGFATARFSGGPGDIRVKLIDVRDANGDAVTGSGLAAEIQKQAIAFIGKE